MPNDAPPSPTSGSSGLLRAAAAEIERQLATALAPGLYLVATPIGNLGDITLRALAVLARADVIYCEDTRHSRGLLTHFAIDRPLRSYHEHNAEEERPRILRQLDDGRIVAVITDAGTPLVSDPGFKLTRAATEAGHGVFALPGASAVLTGLAVSALPSDAFFFAGFPPPKEAALRARLEELRPVPATLILFEAPGRVARLLAAIADVLGDRDVVVARELTKRFEEIVRGTASDVAAKLAGAETRGEIVVLIAPPDATVEATDDAIAAELARLLPTTSVKDATRAVADHLRVARSRVYDIALKLRSGQR
ncbi:MAG: 16S rRNA (cytidine(1402)-2'-O)-methyltransferase [Hyphomicrobiaceae bacterium]